MLIIAIDGFSSCGKSTLAKQLASKLNFIFIDSGAMYRAVALYLINENIHLDNIDEIDKALANIHITFEKIDGINTTFLNGNNVEQDIRSLKVSGHVSEVSALSEVRKKMVALQRDMAGNQGIVMDGRDIGTVVFPDADIKFFITADPIVRAQRRYNELISKNQHAELHDVISNIQHRDKIDSTREDSPLVRAQDAILLDNTDITISEQFEFAMNIIHQKYPELAVK
ncbi:MAG: (d)CMP kinase [Saprospiraceae bacterium]|nr:(d)CMP kinase [Saprospiraceae bacterium]